MGTETWSDPREALRSAGTAELSTFRIGGHRYRVHDPNHGAVGDETVLGATEAQQLLQEVSTIPDLAWVLPMLRQAAAGDRLILLRLHVPVLSGTTAPPPEPAPAPRPPPRQEPKSWIEIGVVDAEGRPLEGWGYRLDLPDGRTLEGKVGSKGVISVHAIDPGSATFTLVESS